jgi:hypothetical protein
MFPFPSPMLLSAPSAASTFDKLSSITVLPTVTHTPGSASYVALKDGGSGGTPITVTITKAAGTSILIMASASIASTGGIANPMLGVNDGSTNYDIAETQCDSTALMRMLTGSRRITGLAAGTYTFTLMLKVPGSNGSFVANKSVAILTAMEVA